MVLLRDHMWYWQLNPDLATCRANTLLPVCLYIYGNLFLRGRTYIHALSFLQYGPSLRTGSSLIQLAQLGLQNWRRSQWGPILKGTQGCALLHVIF